MEKNSVLFAHVPESSVIVIVRWKDGVGKNGVLFAHVPEPLILGTRKGTGWERTSVLFAHVPRPIVLGMMV